MDERRPPRTVVIRNTGTEWIIVRVRCAGQSRTVRVPAAGVSRIFVRSVQCEVDCPDRRRNCPSELGPTARELVVS